MDLKILFDMPPWEWPADTGRILLDVLRDDWSDESDRILAAEMAGDMTVVNDELVEALLSILRDGDASAKLRGRAAISLGPVLEYVDTQGYDDPDGFGYDDAPITEQTFLKVQETLRTLYADADTPKEARRRILETAVRAPQDWHENAIRAAYASDDEDWQLTAVFCMRYIRGFDDWILEALASKNADIHYQAVCAAGNWGINAAWPHIVGLVTSAGTEKRMLLAGIEATAGIRPSEAPEILYGLINAEDEDIVSAVYDALAMADGDRGEGEGEDDEW